MTTTRNRSLIFIGLATLVVPSTFLFLSVNILFFVPLVTGAGCIVAGCMRFPGSTKRRHTLIGALACIAAAVGPSLLAAYANRSGSPVRIVLPAGFQGEFCIVKHRAKGTDLQFEDGTWVFRIPAKGSLVVKDDYPFSIWHQEIYVYQDGRPARVEPLDSTAGEIRTGPGSYYGSTDLDGTTHRWRVIAASTSDAKLSHPHDSVGSSGER